MTTDTTQALEIMELLKTENDLTTWDNEELEELADLLDGAEDDFQFEVDGMEFRFIEADAIWGIYKESIQCIVEDCYELKLDSIPNFVEFSIDWESTAKNAFVDGYGHTFSSYDGSESELDNWFIFRTN